jgi:predicted RNase H-like HicB family nuclease
MKKQDFTYIVWKEESHFVAQCLNLDISSFWENHEEAVVNLREAIELYLEDARDVQVVPVYMPNIVVESLAYA